MVLALSNSSLMFAVNLRHTVARSRDVLGTRRSLSPSQHLRTRRANMIFCRRPTGLILPPMGTEKRQVSLSSQRQRPDLAAKRSPFSVLALTFFLRSELFPHVHPAAS